MTGLRGIDVVVLAGGLGTRIRSVLGDTPKVLAPIGDRTFLDHLLRFLAQQGAGRVVLALGHRADAVEAHLARHPAPISVVTVIEPRPLGTAGAVRHAAPHLTGDVVMVLNGDTWLEVDLGAFLESHQASKCPFSMICVEVPDVGRYGSVETDGNGHLTRFIEKDTSQRGPGLVNGGVLLLARGALDEMAGTSLERDFLAVLPPGSVHTYIARGAAFVDIGTPESLSSAASVRGLTEGAEA